MREMWRREKGGSPPQSLRPPPHTTPRGGIDAAQMTPEGKVQGNNRGNGQAEENEGYAVMNGCAQRHEPDHEHHEGDIDQNPPSVLPSRTHDVPHAASLSRLMPPRWMPKDKQLTEARLGRLCDRFGRFVWPHQVTHLLRQRRQRLARRRSVALKLIVACRGKSMHNTERRAHSLRVHLSCWRVGAIEPMLVHVHACRLRRRTTRAP